MDIPQLSQNSRTVVPHLFLTDSEIGQFLRTPNKARPKYKFRLSHTNGKLLISFISILIATSTLKASVPKNPQIDVQNNIDTNNSALILNPSPSPISEAAPTPKVENDEPQSNIAENTLTYDLLGISAPIIWNINYDNSNLDKQLLDGIVHLASSAKPDQKGIVIISGHSSNYFWQAGSYNSVFAKLPKAKANDIINIRYNKHTYTYTVRKVYETKPDNVALLKSASENQSIRLITCTPVGTSLRRLIVDADLTAVN